MSAVTWRSRLQGISSVREPTRKAEDILLLAAVPCRIATPAPQDRQPNHSTTVQRCSFGTATESRHGLGRAVCRCPCTATISLRTRCDQEWAFSAGAVTSTTSVALDALGGRPSETESSGRKRERRGPNGAVGGGARPSVCCGPADRGPQEALAIERNAKAHGTIPWAWGGAIRFAPRSTSGARAPGSETVSVCRAACDSAETISAAARYAV